MNASQVLRRASDYLARHEVGDPRATAETLLASVLGTGRSDLYAADRGLTSEQAKAFGRALCARCGGTPVQHLTGEVGFRRLTLTVRPGVFVPRPETEVLVEHSLALLVDREAPVVVDVGTGTGAVALALKDERADARVFATDRNEAATSLARENAGLLALDIEVVTGDFLDGLPSGLRGAVDLVVSNPPYVEPTDFAALPAEVRADPPDALIGGIDVFTTLFARCAEWLAPGGAVAVEIGETQGGDVRAEAERAGFVDVRIEPDLNGRDRVVTARLA
jgi:release factor glutamine methyltransferase